MSETLTPQLQDWSLLPPLKRYEKGKVIAHKLFCFQTSAAQRGFKMISIGAQRILKCLGLLVMAAAALARPAIADTITFGGTITQSTQDGTGPASNNPALNNIVDNDLYTVTLSFPGAITAPGTPNLTSASLQFTDTTRAVVENSFGAISLTVTSSGGFDQISLLGCLTTGSDCLLGNFLTGNFQIPAAALNSQNVAAIGLDQPHPLDLLEDDGITDIHGSITTYSYSPTVSPVPEPASVVLIGIALLMFALSRIRISTRRNIHE
jgi:hypothetical protein